MTMGLSLTGAIPVSVMWRERIDFGLAEPHCELGQFGAQPVGELPPLLAGGVGRALGERGASSDAAIRRLGPKDSYFLQKTDSRQNPPHGRLA